MLKQKPAGASIIQKNTLKSICLLVAEFPISALYFYEFIKTPQTKYARGPAVVYLWELLYGFYYLVLIFR